MNFIPGSFTGWMTPTTSSTAVRRDASPWILLQNNDSSYPISHQQPQPISKFRTPKSPTPRPSIISNNVTLYLKPNRYFLSPLLPQHHPLNLQSPRFSHILLQHPQPPYQRRNPNLLPRPPLHILYSQTPSIQPSSPSILDTTRHNPGYQSQFKCYVAIL